MNKSMKSVLQYDIFNIPKSKLSYLLKLQKNYETQREVYCIVLTKHKMN